MRFLLLLLLCACDSRATASDPAAAAAGGGRAEQKSKEYETCGASLHCQDDLRCFDHACARAKRSTLGDFHAARGAELRGKGDLDAAIASYAAALAEYGENVPPDIDCKYGAALAAAKRKADNAELAARVLHRCVNALPGGRMREEALHQLADLVEDGLDPGLLDSPKLADKYLTKGPSRPTADKLTVSFTATPPLAMKTAATLTQKISEGETKSALVACFTAFNEATKQPVMTVTFGAKSAYKNDEEYEDRGGYVLKLDPPTGSTAEQAPLTCTMKALEPVLKGLHESFNAKLTVTVK